MVKSLSVSSLTFIHRSLIRASVDRVWQFHERPDAVQLLTPPWQPMQVLRKTGGLEAGSEVEFRVWMGPIPVTWLARHVACEKHRFFIDEQVRGPFRYWRHEHRFTAENGATRLTDHVEFELPYLGWAVPWPLRLMFRYRHKITRKYCEGRG
jgi:ligand-binding SRPBCC domain-containing protein